MSDFQMNPADVQEASAFMSHLTDRMFDLEPTKPDDPLDCGDIAVQGALAYFVSMYNERGQMTGTWLNGRPDSLHTTAQASKDTDDEAAEFFVVLGAKLQEGGDHVNTTFTVLPNSNRRPWRTLVEPGRN